MADRTVLDEIAGERRRRPPMPTDLTRMDIQILRIHGPQSPIMQLALDAAEAHLDEPTRIEAARQEGYREGVEKAAQWHADQAAAIDEHIAKRGQVEFVSGLGRVACFHRQFATDMLAALSPAPAEPSDGWIEWRGGECPVQDGVETHAKTRDGVIGRSLEPRGWCGWQHDPRAPGLDIVAYRIVKPAEPSDEEWLRGLIAWCRPGVVRDALDRYLAEGTAVPDMTPIVQSAEPSAPVAPDWPTRCAALEADGIAARKRVAALETENAKLREGLKDTTAHLVAAHSLLSRTPRAKKAVPSNTMFDMMLRDYEASCERARALLQGGPDAG